MNYNDNYNNQILEEIFKIDEPEDTQPVSWKAWREGESNYKPFSLQGVECLKNGNKFYEFCNVCGHYLIMCKRYGGQCRSSKCREERIVINDSRTN